MGKLFDYCVAGVGVVLFIIGYVRKQRNLMLAGTIAILVGVGRQDFMAGFMGGFQEAKP